MKRSLIIQLIAGFTILSSIPRVNAVVDWNGIQFGGFASQGYLVNSGENDYFGNTSDGTFDFREYALNASYATGSFRFGAQVFGQKLGDYGDDQISLDWLTVDYQASQYFGIRAGRVKMPRGLYNEALDVDSIRPFVLLPQSVYDARLRDFNASFDGGMIYGNLATENLGDLDYKVFYGNMPLSTDSGASDYFNTDAPFPNLEIEIDSAFGVSLFWNTPVDGLRFGYSFIRFNNFDTTRYVPFRDAIAIKHASAYDQHILSLEYYLGEWILAMEVGKNVTDYEVYYPPTPASIFLYPTQRYGYVSATRRMNDWLELGTYISYSKLTQESVGTPVVFPKLEQTDYAASARFDLTEYMLLKLEIHYMDGAGNIFDIPSHPQPVADRDNSWMLYSAKVTFSF